MGVDSGLPDLPRGDRASGAPIRLSPGWACLLNRWPIPGGSRSRPNCLGILWTPAQPVPASRAPRGLWRLLRRLPPPPTRRLCVHLQMSTVTSKKPVSTRPHRECHGSIHHFQCTSRCGDAIWPADEEIIRIDEEEFRALPPLPLCPRCRALARPNVLMFGDGNWIPDRTESQHANFTNGRKRCARPRRSSSSSSAGRDRDFPP